MTIRAKEAGTAGGPAARLGLAGAVVGAAAIAYLASAAAGASVGDILDLVGKIVEASDLEARPPLIEAVSPKGEAEKAGTRPLFQWRPVQSIPNAHYSLRVVEILPGQTADAAMRANPTHFRQDYIAATAYRYPNTAPPLGSGKRYAWQVAVISDTGAFNTTGAAAAPAAITVADATDRIGRVIRELQGFSFAVGSDDARLADLALRQLQGAVGDLGSRPARVPQAKESVRTALALVRQLSLPAGAAGTRARWIADLEAVLALDEGAQPAVIGPAAMTAAEASAAVAGVLAEMSRIAYLAGSPDAQRAQSAYDALLEAKGLLDRTPPVTDRAKEAVARGMRHLDDLNLPPAHAFKKPRWQTTLADVLARLR